MKIKLFDDNDVVIFIGTISAMGDFIELSHHHNSSSRLTAKVTAMIETATTE